MKSISLFNLLFLLGVNSVTFAQSNSGVICEDKIIAGQIVKRCYQGTTIPAHPQPSTPTNSPPLAPTLNLPKAPPPATIPTFPKPNNPINARDRIINTGSFEGRGVIRGHGILEATDSYNFTIEDGWSGGIKITVVETLATPHGAGYKMWVSSTPGGEPLGPIRSAQRLGATYNIVDPSGPDWGLKLLPGKYFYNIKMVGTEAGEYFVLMNKTTCRWLSPVLCQK